MIDQTPAADIVERGRSVAMGLLSERHAKAGWQMQEMADEITRLRALMTETPAADIVKRLKRQIPYQGKSVVAFLCHEAADEITRLRAREAELELALSESKEQFDHHVKWASDQSANLQRKLDEAVKALETISKAPYQFCAAEVVTANKALSSIRGEG